MRKDFLLDRISGCLLGMAVGDAMGMPASGLTPYEVMLHFQTIDGFYGCPRTGTKPGCYTGVTQLALVTAGAAIRGGGSIEPEILAKAHSDFAARNPRWNEHTSRGLDVLAKGAAPDVCGSESCLDGEFLGKMVVAGLVGGARGSTDQELATTCKAVASLSTRHKPTVLCGFALAKTASGILRSSGSMASPSDLFDSDGSFLCRLVGLCARAESTFQVDHKDKASRRLAFARRGLQAARAVGGFAAVNGASWEAQVACPLALFCFMSSPETFDNVGVVAGMGGASTLNAALAGALAGAMSGAAAVPAGLRDQVESSGKIMAMSEKLASLLATREEDESNGANNNGEPV